MIIFFLIVLIALIFFLQQWTLENGIDAVDGNYWPEENIVDPGESFNLTVELKNQARLPLYFLKVQHEGLDGKTSALSTWLKPLQKVHLRFSILATERGRYLLKRPSVACGDFLGLKETKKELEQYREVVVAPEPYSTQEVKQTLGKFLGDYSVRRFIHEDPILTIGFREYTGREPMKMISWKQSAQKQRLMVKEFDHTVEPVLSILVNVETDLEYKKEELEKCFSIARSVCANLEAKGISYDFYTNALISGETNYSVNEGIGSRHFMKILELLGRSTYAAAFSAAKLIEIAEENGRKERGKIVITPSAFPLSSADGQSLILRSTQL